jgi:RNase H-fold protein (predicted Holliday junction resolvase)
MAVASSRTIIDASLRSIWPRLRSRSLQSLSPHDGGNLSAGRLLARQRGPSQHQHHNIGNGNGNGNGNGGVSGREGEPSTLLLSWNNTLIRNGGHSSSSLRGSGRLLSMDVGDRIVGMAITDPTNHVAMSLPPMHRRLRSDEWRPHSLGFKAAIKGSSSSGGGGGGKSGKSGKGSVNSRAGSSSPHSNDPRYVNATSYRPWYDIGVDELCQPLLSLMNQYDVVGVVVGLPLTMSHGHEDAQTHKTRTFIKQLWQSMHHVHLTATTHTSTDTNSSTSKRSGSSIDGASSATDVPVIWWDERLSTQEARMELRARGIHGNVKQKDIVDSICARNMLQEVIEYGEELIRRS